MESYYLESLSLLRKISNIVWKQGMVFVKNEKAILKKTERAVVKKTCSQKVVNSKTIYNQMDMLGLKKTKDQLATANRIKWY